MNLKIFKLLIIGTFAVFAVGAFLFPNNKTEAQTEENILTKVADYKTWKQVQKPEVKKETEVKIETEVVTTDVLSISDSTIAG